MLKEFTLSESLVQKASWELYNFGYNGPNPPYVRIGGMIEWSPRLRLVPCFESFIVDRIYRRTKVSLFKHLQLYEKIAISPIAVEEAFGKNSLYYQKFPFDTWFRFSRVSFGELELKDDDHTVHAILAMHVLCTAVGVHLRGDRIESL